MFNLVVVFLEEMTKAEKGTLNTFNYSLRTQQDWLLGPVVEPCSIYYSHFLHLLYLP